MVLKFGQNAQFQHEQVVIVDSGDFVPHEFGNIQHILDIRPAITLDGIKSNREIRNHLTRDSRKLTRHTTLDL